MRLLTLRLKRRAKSSFAGRALGACVALVAAIGCSTRIIPLVQRSDQSELVYVFERLAFEGKPSLQIDVLFRGNRDGKTPVRLPSEWAGQNRMERSIKSLQVINPQARIVLAERGDERWVHHRAGEVVHLRYRLVQDWSGFPENQEKYLRPILQESYFHFLGGSSLIYPVQDENSLLTVTFRWLSAPSDWKLFNSFGPIPSEQQVESTVNGLKRAFYVGGNLRARELTVQGKKIQVVLRGQWHFADEDYFSGVERVLQAQAQFWGDEFSSVDFIEMVPVGLSCCYFRTHTTGRSFAAFVSTDRGWGDDFRQLFGQGLFEQNLRARLSQTDARDKDWFFKGVSQYYSRLLSLRSGQIGFGEFIEDYGDALVEHQVSPEKSSALSDDPQLSAVRQKYLRADLLMGWMHSLWKEGQDLDGAFKVYAQRVAKKQAELNPRSMGRALAPENAEKISDQWNRGVSHGDLPPVRGWFGACVSEVKKKRSPFELGFDLKPSKEESHIVGLKKNSAAARAGLRNFQRLLAWRIVLGDPGTQASVRVVDRNQERVISFFPAGVPQLVTELELDRAALNSDTARCVATWIPH